MSPELEETKYFCNILTSKIIFPLLQLMVATASAVLQLATHSAHQCTVGCFLQYCRGQWEAGEVGPLWSVSHNIAFFCCCSILSYNEIINIIYKIRATGFVKLVFFSSFFKKTFNKTLMLRCLALVVFIDQLFYSSLPPSSPYFLLLSSQSLAPSPPPRHSRH